MNDEWTVHNAIAILTDFLDDYEQELNETTRFEPIGREEVLIHLQAAVDRAMPATLFRLAGES